MTITRDIVLDLLPLYAAGEASPDSRAAVDAFVAADASVARLLRALQDEAPLAPNAAIDLPPALERTAVNRTRAAIRRRSWTLGLALFLTLLPLTIVFSGDRVTFFMLRDHWPASLLSWVSAAVLWLYYARSTRNLKAAGL